MKPSCSNRASTRRFSESCGFSLVETLVSILVLGLGVIGAAGMQLNAMRVSRQTAFRTSAVRLAVEMADMIKANDRLVASGGLLANGFEFQAATAQLPSASSCNSKDADCDAEAIGRFEVREWTERLRSQLPSARAVICRDSRPWSVEQSTYRWDCHSSSADAPAASPLAIKIGWLGPGARGIEPESADQAYAPGVVLVMEPSAR